MPLPLLMLAAAGLAGGGNYLLDRINQGRIADNRTQQLGILHDYFNSAPGQQLEKLNPGAAEGAFAQAQAEDSQPSLLGKRGSAGTVPTASGVGDIIKQLEATRLAQMNRGTDQLGHDQDALVAQANADRTADMERQRIGISQGQLNLERQQNQFQRTIQGLQDLRGDYEKSVQVHTGMQTAFQQFRSELEGGTDANVQAAAVKLANLLDPGSVVRDEERQTWIGRGGVGNQIAGQLNNWQGKGATPATRKELLDVGLRAYRPFHDQAMNIREQTAQRVRDYNTSYGTAIDPNQVLGAAFNPGYDPGQVQNGPPGGILDPNSVPKGFSTTPPPVPGSRQSQRTVQGQGRR